MSRRAASRARAELERLLDEGGGALDADLSRLRTRAGERVASLERETPAMSKWINRELFALGIPILALYQILGEDGLGRDEAVAQIDGLIRAAYELRLASPITKAVAGRMFRLPIVRNTIARAAERAREPGGFVMRRVEALDEDTLLALDVERCPLAELFARYEVPELGPLICMIDDLVVEAMQGVELERSGTIAAGARRCDFRYRRSKG